MVPIFGIETEYGITRDGLSHLDPVVESMELVRSYVPSPFKQSWDYAGEDPHIDQRGFRVSSLQQDSEEAEFAKYDSERPFSFREMKSDLVLTNGARYYNDHTHPEYSTPECRSVMDLVAHDRAGERILLASAKQRNQLLNSSPVKLYKNNTDYHGHSYGCHENYLISRTINFEKLAALLMAFLVTRQIIIGAGKTGIEAQDHTIHNGIFQVSQRADFMETLYSVDTMHDRPILNTRDEPHANREKFRRLHLISGDSNMAEYATALKVGITRVILEMINKGVCPLIDLQDPVRAMKEISQDTMLELLLPCKNMNPLSAIDVQRRYLDVALKEISGCDEETDWILCEWGNVLDLLVNDRTALVGSLDWVTKYWLLETFIESEKIDWTDPWLVSLDLEYHNIDPKQGLFLSLENTGNTRRICTDDQIHAAMNTGPLDTRAGIRGLCISKFSDKVEAVQWERIFFKGEGSSKNVLEMGDLFDLDDIKKLRAAVMETSSPSVLCDY